MNSTKLNKYMPVRTLKVISTTLSTRRKTFVISFMSLDFSTKLVCLGLRSTTCFANFDSGSAPLHQKLWKIWSSIITTMNRMELLPCHICSYNWLIEIVGVERNITSAKIKIVTRLVTHFNSNVPSDNYQHLCNWTSEVIRLVTLACW